MEQLLAPQERPLVALCYGILGSVEDAEDAAQEAFLRALSGLFSFRGEAGFRSWLFRIVTNLCLTWRSSRRPAEPWEEQENDSSPHVASPEAIALSHLRLMEALGSLPPRRRAVILLKEWEGCSLAEIARVMGWSEVRVKNELYKARLALAERQRREAGEGEER